MREKRWTLTLCHETERNPIVQEAAWMSKSITPRSPASTAPSCHGMRSVARNPKCYSPSLTLSHGWLRAQRPGGNHRFLQSPGNHRGGLRAHPRSPGPWVYEWNLHQQVAPGEGRNLECVWNTPQAFFLLLPIAEALALLIASMAPSRGRCDCGCG